MIGKEKLLLPENVWQQELFQHMFMLDESTLYGKYADGHFYLPRSSIMI
ncbi:hypothetical protein [uncultured Eubacterium sp.]|nr:hypothetical protein [uncultured Eubacterium sp.]